MHGIYDYKSQNYNLVINHDELMYLEMFCNKLNIN